MLPCSRVYVCVCCFLACPPLCAVAASAPAAAAGFAGEGAYGQVYLGLNEESGELMAVKSLQLLGRRGSRESQTQLSELKQELECYRNLSHTHIVGYIGNEFDTASNCLYIFLEYVPGESAAPFGQKLHLMCGKGIRDCCFKQAQKHVHGWQPLQISSVSTVTLPFASPFAP